MDGVDMSKTQRGPNDDRRPKQKSQRIVVKNVDAPVEQIQEIVSPEIQKTNVVEIKEDV